MYPRNNASPPRIAIGAVVQIADGAVQTSGVSVVVRPEGGAESAGGGTIAYSAASGVVYYTPTQAETNYTAFCVIAYKADCIPAQVTVVTTASSTAGVAELDSATATQIDTIEAALTTLGSDSTTVERSVSDTNAITFSWPVSGATITGTASLNNGSYGAVAGAIAFLRTETGRHYYTLAYNVADRPAAEGQVRYKFVDGTYTGYVVLRTVNLVTAAQVNAQVLDVLSVDTFAELTAPPAATSSLKDKITWLFMYARNKVTQTAAQRKLYRDDGTTVAGTSGTTDDGTTFTKGEDA
jgi:hypothetical protein